MLLIDTMDGITIRCLQDIMNQSHQMFLGVAGNLVLPRLTLNLKDYCVVSVEYLSLFF